MILEPVRVGVIGCEGYSMQWIKRLLSVPNCARVVAVSALDPTSSGAQFCRRQGLRIVDSVAAMLQTAGVEVVVNPTPIHLHQSLTMQCLQAGVQVWLEKPAVATVQAYDELRQFAATRNLAIPICFNSLFSRLTQDIKRELVDGVYGRVRRIKGIGAWIRTSSYFRRNDWAGRLQAHGEWILDGDLNNVFAHVLCNNLFFAGTRQAALAQMDEIKAELYRCNDLEAEDTSCTRIVTREGIEILNFLTLASPREIAPLTVIETDKAEIRFEDFSLIRVRHQDGTVEEREAYQEHRIEMISHLCRTFRLGGDYIGDLREMRPFTEAVNGAFESSGSILTIPPAYPRSDTDADVQHHTVPSLHEIMQRAFDANALFSELGVPWARAGQAFSLRDYANFPQRFRAVPEDAEKPAADLDRPAVRD